MSAPAAAGSDRTFASAQRPDPIRLMIVDDSAVARAVLSRMLSLYKEFEIVALAANADEALEALGRVSVDIVLLDVEMPGTNGLKALPDILRLGRGARVLIVSSLCEEGAAAAVEALALGAADTLPKPGSSHFSGRFSQVLAERLLRIGAAAPAAPAPAAPARTRPVPDQKIGCIAIGASTGGLHAIGELLKGLPPMVGAPLLVTQHLPPVFVPFFAQQLEAVSGRTVRVAAEGAALRSEEILLAPGHAHLSIEQRGSRVVATLTDAPAPSGCMPSVDVMLGAVASVYGPSGIGIVLSGMGRDGLAGAGALADRGGCVMVQDRQSSAVWGMPRAVAEAGLAAEVLPPAALARRIAEHVKGRAWN